MTISHKIINVLSKIYLVGAASITMTMFTGTFYVRTFIFNKKLVYMNDHRDLFNPRYSAYPNYYYQDLFDRFVGSAVQGIFFGTFWPVLVPVIIKDWYDMIPTKKYYVYLKDGGNMSDLTLSIGQPLLLLYPFYARDIFLSTFLNKFLNKFEITDDKIINDKN